MLKALEGAELGKTYWMDTVIPSTYLCLQSHIHRLSNSNTTSKRKHTELNPSLTLVFFLSTEKLSPSSPSRLRSTRGLQPCSARMVCTRTNSISRTTGSPSETHTHIYALFAYAIHNPSYPCSYRTLYCIILDSRPQTTNIPMLLQRRKRNCYSPWGEGEGKSTRHITF